MTTCLLIPYQTREDILQETTQKTLKMLGANIKPLTVIMDDTKGLGKARNCLAHQTAADDYLFFLDTGVSFTEHTFHTIIKPAIENGKLLVYRGNNTILCTKILGMPKELFEWVDGFDSTFHIGEDLELGVRMWNKFKITENIVEVPVKSVDHVAHPEHGSYWDSLRVRVRVALRYGAFGLLKPQRMKDVFGMFLLPLLVLYYVEHNPRKGFAEFVEDVKAWDRWEQEWLKNTYGESGKIAE